MSDDDDQPARSARALLVAEKHGVLSTISVHLAGYPYGSLTPFALSRRGAPIVLISTLAAHTKNLMADARACLFVADHREQHDPQAGGRVSLLGRVNRVPSEDEADARARYLARVPQSAGYFKTHDFQLWEIGVEEVRLIAGFGKIGWLRGAAVMRDPARDPLFGESMEVCRHMNDDHGQALRTLCRSRGGEAEGARMVGLDSLGFDVESAGGRLRFDFSRELSSTDEVRSAVIALVGLARIRPPNPSE